jgi:hypothetical protein
LLFHVNDFLKFKCLDFYVQLVKIEKSLLYFNGNLRG